MLNLNEINLLHGPNVIAVASTSILLSTPSYPTIWAPSNLELFYQI